MNELILYTTPREARVRWILDSGLTFHADTPTTANGRQDAHVVELPAGTPQQGAAIHVELEGFVPFEGRGIVLPSTDGEARFLFDDCHLAQVAIAPPVTPPPAGMPTDPLGIINTVFATGLYDLRTLDGCGTFTEACALALYEHNFPLWGHIKKEPGQNQYAGHAVDAVQCLGGVETGIWDIIFSSVSPEARPAYNYAGPANPALWLPPTGAPAALLQGPIVRVVHVEPKRGKR